MTDTVAVQSAYVALLDDGSRVAEQSAYVAMVTTGPLDVAEVTSYIALIVPAAPSGRRSQPIVGSC